jgi:stage V sporulation protein S
MDRILRGLRIGSEATFPPDAPTNQEDSVMQSAPPANEPLPDEGDAATPQVAAVGKRSDILKVSARSRPSAVAGAIAGVVRESGRAEVQAIGAGAANQAIKAIAIARDYLAETGINAVCLPSFIDVVIDDEDRTALRLIVEPR